MFMQVLDIVFHLVDLCDSVYQSAICLFAHMPQLVSCTYLKLDFY